MYKHSIFQHCLAIQAGYECLDPGNDRSLILFQSPDAAVIQLFTEVRRHKPSVIYIPNVDTWYRTVGEAVVSVFRGLVRSLAPTEPVLLLGILESENRDVDPRMIKDLFGFSRRNQFEIDRPSKVTIDCYPSLCRPQTSDAVV